MLTKYHAIIFISILTMLVLLGLHLLGIASNVINHQNSTGSGSQVALARGAGQNSNSNNFGSAGTTNSRGLLPLTATTSGGGGSSSSSNNNNNDYTHPISFDRISSSTSNSGKSIASTDGDLSLPQAFPARDNQNRQDDNSSNNNQLLTTTIGKRINQPEYPIDHYQISQSTNQPLDNQIPPTPTQQHNNRFTNNNNNNNNPFTNPFGPPAPPLPMPPLPLQPSSPVAPVSHHQQQQSTQSPQASMTAPITATNQPQQQFGNQQQSPPSAASEMHNFAPLRPSSVSPQATPGGSPNSAGSPNQASMKLSTGINQIESDTYTPPIMYGNSQFDGNNNQQLFSNNLDSILSNQQQQQQQPQQFSDDSRTVNNNPINTLTVNSRRDQNGVTAATNNNNQNSNYINYQTQPRNINNNNDNKAQVDEPIRHQTSPLPSSYFEQQQHQSRQKQQNNLLQQPRQQLEQQQGNNQLHNRLANFVPTDKRILPPPLPSHYKDLNTARRLPPPATSINSLSINNNIELNRNTPPLSSRLTNYNNNANSNHNNRHGEPDIGLTALPPYSLPGQQQLFDQRQHSNNKLEQQKLQHLSTNVPLCARALGAASSFNDTLANNYSINNNPVVMCQEDSDYPTKAVMAALELYGPQILEQIMPQTVINNNHQQISKLNQRSQQQQLQQDSLRPLPVAGPLAQNDHGGAKTGSYNLPAPPNYDNLCKSKITLVQPRRAKNIQGQWKVVVNFPNADRFRGISLSQPVRIEECNQQNNECGGTTSISDKSNINNNHHISPIPKTRCLQQYGDHRLVAWSSQRGLHVDMFRLPVSCSCHLRR